ncbi:hypothetical protein MED297_18917 [Reinekea sp. MED297]|uniref:Uncharacterized protein n=1 Tax=Reinekea blandensis MED297 TaxID=314283 RepID=A4BKR6_9GAMM|nr:hypothetical protein MED297_18917 [Reinekea sp. MED297] [Reinekea blandensis MED297]
MSFNESSFYWDLSRGQLESFTRDLFGNTFHFVENFTWLNLANPVFNVTLTFTLTHFKRLLSNRLIREYANPDFTATLNMTSHRSTSRFDLTSSNSTTTCRFQCVFTEAYFATALRQTTVAAFLHLAEFCTFWL